MLARIHSSWGFSAAVHVASLHAELFIVEVKIRGMMQEYTMMDGKSVYGWPKSGYPAPQGPFYCGVGDESAYGRPLAEDHLDACVECGLTISGINAEVRPQCFHPCVVLESTDQHQCPVSVRLYAVQFVRRFMHCVCAGDAWPVGVPDWACWASGDGR